VEKVNQKKSNKGNVSRKHMLPDDAVDILNEWFDEHITNPYPQMEEKERLAKRGNITVKQVNAWFSNRRNRSQNTRPKRIQRDMEKKMSGLIQELVSNPNGDMVNNVNLLEKFRRVLVEQDINKY
jgi:predicted methyltransferase